MRFIVEMVSQAIDRLASGDEQVWETIWRTLLLAIESTCLALAIGLPLA